MEGQAKNKEEALAQVAEAHEMGDLDLEICLKQMYSHLIHPHQEPITYVRNYSGVSERNRVKLGNSIRLVRNDIDGIIHSVDARKIDLEPLKDILFRLANNCSDLAVDVEGMMKEEKKDNPKGVLKDGIS